jgi:hypothetical protein
MTATISQFENPIKYSFLIGLAHPSITKISSYSRVGQTFYLRNKTYIQKA